MRTRRAVERANGGREADSSARLSAALDAIGGGFGAVASNAFRLMGLVEDELAERWPGRKGEPREAFGLCARTSPIAACPSDDLFLAHVREILDRAKKTPRDWYAYARLTKAEVLALLSVSSLRHPLAHHEVLLFERLFSELFPREACAKLQARTLLPEEVSETERALEEWLRRPSPEREEMCEKLRKELL